MSIKAKNSYLCEEQKNDNQLKIAELESELTLLREGYGNNSIELRKAELTQVNVLAVTDKSIKFSVGDDICYGTWTKREYFDKRFIMFESLGEFELNERNMPIKFKDGGKNY